MRLCWGRTSLDNETLSSPANLQVECLIVEVLATRANFLNQLVSVLWSTSPLSFLRQMFLFDYSVLWFTSNLWRISCRIRLRCTFICTVIKSDSEWSNALWYYHCYDTNCGTMAVTLPNAIPWRECHCAKCDNMSNDGTKCDNILVTAPNVILWGLDSVTSTFVSD